MKAAVFFAALAAAVAVPEIISGHGTETPAALAVVAMAATFRAIAKRQEGGRA